MAEERTFGLGTYCNYIIEEKQALETAVKQCKQAYINNTKLKGKTHWDSKCKQLGPYKPKQGNVAKAVGSRGGSRAAATFKMERFVIIVNGFQPLTIITKRSILNVAVSLDPPLGSFYSNLKDTKNDAKLFKAAKKLSKRCFKKAV